MPRTESVFALSNGEAEAAKQRRHFGVAILSRLKLEHAITGAKFEVERQSPQEVLQGLIKSSLFAQFSDRAAQRGAGSAFAHPVSLP